MIRSARTALLGITFHDILKASLTDEQWATMVSRQRAREDQAKAEGVPLETCASHDFLDANMVMLEAFDWHKVPHPVAENEGSMLLWSKAWEIGTGMYMGRLPTCVNCKMTLTCFVGGEIGCDDCDRIASEGEAK